ncbi:MAG: hypothetical protein MHM6MM_004620 [Cercozoa sp. M6MM]
MDIHALLTELEQPGAFTEERLESLPTPELEHLISVYENELDGDVRSQFEKQDSARLEIALRCTQAEIDILDLFDKLEQEGLVGPGVSEKRARLACEWRVIEELIEVEARIKDPYERQHAETRSEDDINSEIARLEKQLNVLEKEELRERTTESLMVEKQLLEKALFEVEHPHAHAARAQVNSSVTSAARTRRSAQSPLKSLPTSIAVRRPSQRAATITKPKPKRSQQIASQLKRLQKTFASGDIGEMSSSKLQSLQRRLQKLTEQKKECEWREEYEAMPTEELLRIKKQLTEEFTLLFDSPPTSNPTTTSVVRAADEELLKRVKAAMRKHKWKAASLLKKCKATCSVKQLQRWLTGHRIKNADEHEEALKKFLDSVEKQEEESDDESSDDDKILGKRPRPEEPKKRRKKVIKKRRKKRRRTVLSLFAVFHWGIFVNSQS